MPDIPQFVIIAICVASGVFAAFGVWVAAQKDRSLVEGAILGLLFGPVGVIVEACLPCPDRRVPEPLRPAPRPTPAPQPRPKEAAPQPDMSWLK